MIRTTVLLAVAAALTLGPIIAIAGCPPPSPLPPQPDADAAPAPVVDAPAPPPPSPSASCAAACASLRAAGCPEGSSATCTVALQNAESLRLVRTPSGAALTCSAIAGVRTPSEARSLGIACVGAGEATTPTRPSGSGK